METHQTFAQRQSEDGAVTKMNAVQHSGVASQPRRASNFAPYLIVFLLALGVRLWFNFATPHVDATFACDGAEYLRDAQGLQTVASLPFSFWSTAWASAFGSLDSTQAEFVHRELSPLKELCQAGPIFPLFILTSFKLSGTQALLVNTIPPIAAQCLLTSLSCLLIALTGTVLWDKRAGLTAGVLAAIYPGFIVNSGRLYSESFAMLLICAILFMVSFAFIKRELSLTGSFALGVLAALLHVTRSVMAAISLALVPITYAIGGKRKKEKLALYVIGFALVFLPWMFLQKCTFGKTSFVVDRVGHYNFSIGNNVDTQGWLTFPYPVCENIPSKSFVRIWREGFQISPERWFKLMLDKPVRLFSVPWNDFKTAIGPFNLRWQIAFHELLLLLAGIGVVTSLSEKSKDPGNWRKVIARSGILAFFLFHFVYCGFITVPRYALPAVPCIILFAAAAITAISRHQLTKAALQAAFLLLAMTLIFFLIERCDFVIPVTRLAGENWLFALLALQVIMRLLAYAAVFFLAFRLATRLNVSQRVAAISALMLFLTSLPGVCLPLRVFGRWNEWAEPFNQPGKTIVQTIRLDNQQIEQMLNRQSYVMVNLENGAFLADDLRIRVNGVDLDTFPIPIMSFAEDLERYMTLANNSTCPEVEYILNDITYFVGGFPLQLRQWFLVPISPDKLKAALASTQPGQSGTLNISVEKLTKRPNTFYGAFRTDPRFIFVPSVTQFSWEKGFYSVENDRGLSDFALDNKVSLPIEKDVVTSSSLPNHPPHPYVRILVSPKVYDRSGLMSLLSDTSLPRLVRSTPGISAAASVVNPKDHYHGSLNVIRFTADLSAQPGVGNLSVGLIAGLTKPDGTSLLYASKWFPQVVTPVSASTHLDYAFPIIPDCLPAKLTSLTATLSDLGPRDPAKAPGLLSNSGSAFGQACLASESEGLRDSASGSGPAIASGQLGRAMPNRAVVMPEDLNSGSGGSEENLRFRIYELPNNPFSFGHEIY
jgi:hypothetical protein